MTIRLERKRREALVNMAQGSRGGELAAIGTETGYLSVRRCGGLLSSGVCVNFAVTPFLTLYVPDRFPGEDESGGPLCQLWSHQRP